MSRREIPLDLPRMELWIGWDLGNTGKSVGGTAGQAGLDRALT